MYLICQTELGRELSFNLGVIQKNNLFFSICLGADISAL